MTELGRSETAHGSDAARRYFMSNLIASCAQPDCGGPFDELSGR